MKIQIKKDSNCWLAKLPDGPYANKWMETPFTIQATEEQVRERIQQRNPGYFIEIIEGVKV